MKKRSFEYRRIILQIVSIFLWTFFAMLSFAVEFRITFNGFGDPPSVLTGRECLIITIMHFLPFSIMVAVCISNITYLKKRKVKFQRYLQMTFLVLTTALISIGLVWIFAMYFSDIWSEVIDITLDIINFFADKG